MKRLIWILAGLGTLVIVAPEWEGTARLRGEEWPTVLAEAPSETRSENAPLALPLTEALAQGGEPVVSAEVLPPAIAPSTEMLAEEIASLRAWRASIEEADAAAAAKASLKPSINVRGRVFLDTANFTQNDASVLQSGNAENGVELRTAWVLLGGNLMEDTTYRLWFDLSGQVSLLDVYVDRGGLPGIQNIRVGHFFEPFGMEQLTPNVYLTFMERSSAFNLGRNMGVMAHSDDAEANWTYGLGVFVSEQGAKPPRFQDDNDATALTGRVTWLPWYDETAMGSSVFHLGAGYSLRKLGDEEIEFSNRPESNLAPETVDTGVLAAERYQLFGLEAAWAMQSLIVQAEYHGAMVDRIGAPQAYLDGYYIQTSYFLTGEHRAYNRRSGSFANRVVPEGNFLRTLDGAACGPVGLGAWEIAYRYARTDLDSSGVAGGDTGLHHWGLNWYLNPYTRTMFEYIYADTSRAGIDEGHLHAVQMRMQFDW